MKRKWATAIRVSFFVSILLFWYNESYSQKPKDITRGLEKGAKTVLKEPVKVPGVDLDMAGARGLGLAQAVNEAINNTLKETLKTDFWNTENLTAGELVQVHSSTTPVSEYLAVSDSADAFQELLFANLNTMQVPELLDGMGNDMGFYHSGTTNEYMQAVMANLLASLDRSSKVMLTD